MIELLDVKRHIIQWDVVGKRCVFTFKYWEAHTAYKEALDRRDPYIHPLNADLNPDIEAWFLGEK